MASATCHLHLLKTLVLFSWALVSAHEHKLLSCETTSPDASGYRCNSNASNKNCQTFAILRANSYYPTLSKLSYHFGLDRVVIAEASGFSADTEFLPEGQPLLIPIDCKCNGSFYEAHLIKTTIKGESFNSIAESFEGLTTCRALKEKNPRFSTLNLDEKVKLLVPLRCSCPNEVNPEAKFLVSYPLSERDKVSDLALQFNITPEAILSANNKSLSVPPTSRLLPHHNKPILNPLTQLKEPNSHLPPRPVPVSKSHKKKGKMKKRRLYIGLSCAIAGLSIAIALAFSFLWLKKKKKTQNSIKHKDLELQQLSLSVRTTSDKKVSFEGSQDTAQDCHILETTIPRKLVESYTLEDLKKATEEFSSSNQIEGSVYHGLLKGKNLAIKKIRAETVGRIDFGLASNPTHFHPNIVRFLGSCFSEGEDADGYLLFEYARNGSLRDWIHNKLAIKNQFIASCYCFLAWNQRVEICYDVAVALQYMHQIGYVHCNVKSRNIFLDEDFNAKIGNFGMAKCVEAETNDEQKADLGYLAPEFLQEGSISPATDIFAYGMVVLEVLTGQTPTNFLEKQETQIWVSDRLKSVLEPIDTEEFKELMDQALGENYSVDAAIELANLARFCVEKDPSLRPSASKIVEKVSKFVEKEHEEKEILEKGNSVISESSCKPLVKAVD